MLKDTFITSASFFYKDSSTADKHWQEILVAYQNKRRHYHNLSHLENMLSEMYRVKSEIADWETMTMALVYHDIVYKATASDNEEKSAEVSNSRLRDLRFPDDKITRCAQMILATKGHTISEEQDINLFTDADLSILGKPWDTYNQYFQNIRKEYSIFPDFLYNPGRKKVLKHFLEMPRIFKTDSFFKLYEDQGKQNIQRELELLTG